jgi:1,4-alpha-glucan branching enzyme
VSESAAAAPGVLLARHGVTLVQFVLVAPDARRVALVGDFNDWDPAATPLRASAGGAWSAAVQLSPGRHRYAFVVDGVRWLADPAAPPAPDDDFGTPGSVVTVGA